MDYIILEMVESILSPVMALGLNSGFIDRLVHGEQRWLIHHYNIVKSLYKFKKIEIKKLKELLFMFSS